MHSSGTQKAHRFSPHVDKGARAQPRLAFPSDDAEYHVDEARAAAHDADAEKNCACSFEGIGACFSSSAEKPPGAGRLYTP